MCIDSMHLREDLDVLDSTDPIKFGDVIKDLNTPQGKQAIFWARVLYALLSLPFVLFWVPGLQGILTHTSLTGYNKNGVAVPYTLRPMPELPPTESIKSK